MSPVEAAQFLPGADGFVIYSLPRPCPNRNGCPNEIISKAATSVASKLNKNQQDPYYDPSVNVTFDNQQLKKKFKHAKKFGVEGNYNSANRDLYRKKLIEHNDGVSFCLPKFSAVQK